MKKTADFTDVQVKVIGTLHNKAKAKKAEGASCSGCFIQAFSKKAEWKLKVS